VSRTSHPDHWSSNKRVDLKVRFAACRLSAALYLVTDKDAAMPDLTFIERTKLEKLFQMGSSYVLDFSNQTFADFVTESTGGTSTTPSTPLCQRLQSEPLLRVLDAGA
jgi:hypothetical protein